MRRICGIATCVTLAGSRYWTTILLCGLMLAGGAGRSQAAAQPPLGVYAHIDIVEAIQDIQGTKGTTPLCSAVPPYEDRQTKKLHTRLRVFYEEMMENRAVSGIALGIPWCLVQPYPPPNTNPPSVEPWCTTSPTFPQGYDLSYVDDAIVAANTVAAKDKAKGTNRPPPTIQLTVIPGVDSPSWLLDVIKARNIVACSPLGGASAPNCGWVPLPKVPEQSHAQSDNLPVPWSDLYISYWTGFLKTLAANSEITSLPLDSLAVVGPVGASAEMILPTDPTAPGIDLLWTDLIREALACSATDCSNLHHFPNYGIYADNFELVFVDAWNATIDTYEQIFSGSNLTLVLVADAGSGLPDLGTSLPAPHTIHGVNVPIYKALLPDQKTQSSLLPDDCGATPSVSCQAKVAVLSHFAAPASGPQPSYLKATQVGGMTASSNTVQGNISVIGVKILTSSQLLQETAPWTPLLGGSEFDHPVSGSAKLLKEEGCVNGKSDPPCALAEEGALNALNVFFACTPVGANPASRYGDTFATETPTQCSSTSAPLTGSSPIQYVYVDYHDIQYAASPANACPASPFPVPVSSKPSSCWSMQDLLSQANFDLFQMAGQMLTGPVFTCKHEKRKDACVPASAH
jgi:hypothetical protein